MQLWTPIPFLLAMIIFGHTNGYSQDDNPITLDSMDLILEDLRSQDSFALYYDTLRVFESTMVNGGLSSELFKTDKYYNWIPVDKADSLTYRRALMHHAYKYKRHNNDYYGAKPFYERATKYATAPDSLDHFTWYIENDLGSIYARLNEYDKAIYYYKKAAKAFELREEYGRMAGVYANLGDAVQWNGDEASMFYYFEEGKRLATAAVDFESLQGIEMNYAQYYSEQGDIEKAMRHLDKAKGLLHKLQGLHDFEETRSTVDGIEAQLLSQQGNYESAIALYRKQLKNLQKLQKSQRSREQAKAMHQLAQCYMLNKQYDEADVLMVEAFEKLNPLMQDQRLPDNQYIISENTYTDLLSLRSQFYFDNYVQSKHRPYQDSSFMALELAMHANDQLDRLLIRNLAKYKSIATNKQLVDLGISYCYEYYQENPQPELLIKARELFDRSKSLLLADNLRKRSNLDSLADSLRIKFQNTEKEIYQSYEIIGEANKDSVLNRITELYDLLSQIVPSVEAENPQHIKEPYIEYLLTTEEAYAYSNIGGKKIYKLGTVKNIESLIDVCFKEIKDQKNIELEDKLNKLYDVLIPMDISRIKSLSIIADGLLSVFPFDILKKNAAYLFESHVLHYDLSAREINSSDESTEINNMLCIAPEYGQSEKTMQYALSRGDLYPLHFAREEVEQVARTMGFDASIIRDIDPFVFSDTISDFDLLHYSGHAIVDNELAYLAIGDSSKLHNKIDLDQLMHCSNNLEMVVLSACETGLGEYKYGEGVRSLASAFLNSGSKSIVYSLWNANDQSTAELMQLFYKHLKNGKSKDVAMNLAKRDYLHNANPLKKHPYYWAGFSVVGNTKPIAEASMPYGIYMGLIIGAVLIFIFLRSKNQET